MLTDLQKWAKLKRSPEEILSNRKSGQIYSADFTTNEGRYVSSVVDSNDPVDISLRISPKIEVRFTYIFKENDIVGIQLSKLNVNGVLDKIHLSTLDWEGVQKLLYLFNGVDIKSIASGSLILDKSIISNSDDLVKFLNTLVADPEGKRKFEEIAQNLESVSLGDLRRQLHRKQNADLLENLLNDSFFNKYKQENRLGKSEEVWQQFLKSNDWLLGSDVVRVLDERDIDEESVSDLPIESIDGFLDIIELKLPSATFWTMDTNPTADLTKSLMQCMRYIVEYERRFNDHKKIEQLGIDILKPRITLIYGRSINWTPQEKERFRVLNSSFHNITVLTYDHLLQRAKKLIGQERI